MAKQRKINTGKFKIDDLKELALCANAHKYLKEKYGEEMDDLANRKADVMQLIDEKKGDWVVTFCLSLLDDVEDAQYYLYVVEEVERDFKGKTIKTLCRQLSAHIMGKDDFSQEILNKRKFFEEETNYKTISNEPVKLAYHHLCRGLIHLIRAIQQGESLKKRLPVAITHLVEAYSVNEAIKDEFVHYDNTFNNKYKHYAHYAMSLTKIWPNE